MYVCICMYIYIIMMMQNIINHSEMYILHHVAMAMLHSFKKMNKTQTRHIHTHCVEKSFWNPMRHHLFNIDIALIVFFASHFQIKSDFDAVPGTMLQESYDWLVKS